MGIISILFSASSIDRLGIDGHTLDKIIRFAGFINLRIWIVWSLMIIDLVWCIRLSRTCLLDRKIQKRLLDILDMKIIFIGLTIFPIASTYSFCGIPSIESNTNA